MTRFQKLTLTTVVATYILVVIGAITRGTGSGLGCPDWPLCYGELLPSLGDTAAWIEWSHRTWAALVGLLVVAVAFVALRHHRRDRSLVLASLGAVALTGFQAWLGKITVETSNAGEWVTAHLATAMVLLALLMFVAIRSHYPRSLARGAGSQRLTLVLAFTSASVYALLLFGSHVTATGAALVYLDWPFFRGQLLPLFAADPSVAALQMSHFLHRLVAAIVAVAVGWLPVVAVVGLVAAMVALVLGLIGRRRARAGAGGAGFATAGIALGAIGMVVGAVGIVITVVLVGAVERYEDPAANTTTVTSCEVDGRRLEATGTLTNDGDRAASFTVRVELEGDRAEHATRRERLAEVDDVAPGASATWSAGLLLGDRSPPSDPVCSVVAVHGPLPFGIDPGP